MAGAIIPDDWDGVSFNCQKVVWPASVLWRAILFGQITEPEGPSFWDEDTGDVGDAVDAVNDAEVLTAPEFWTEDCDVIPGHPVSAFRVTINAQKTLVADVWKRIDWDIFQWEHNEPSYVVSAAGHRPLLVGKDGLWHYDLQVELGTTWADLAVRAIIAGSGKVIAQSLPATNFFVMSWDYDWQLAGNKMVIEVKSSLAGTIEPSASSTVWSAHYLGDIS